MIKGKEGTVRLGVGEQLYKVQEFDHIVVGPCGVILIETKYYNGKIIIDQYGNWIREREDGKQVGERNPVQQIERHHMIAEEILGISDIHDVVCIAHDGAIMIGIENSVVPIVKYDMLVHYIKNLTNKSGKLYSENEQKELIHKIESQLL